MGAPAILETHASILIFLGDRVYKVKKPVSFEFLDLRTSGARRAALSSEVQLNRRLSPDIYLGIGEFSGPDGQREPVLCMRRLPDERKLSTLIHIGMCSEADVVEIARKVATFHESCDVVPSGSTIGSGAHLGALWQDAFEVLERCADIFPDHQLAAARTLANEYLEGRASLLASRRLAGRIRDGHGDLLADDIFLLADGIRILDCLEFDPSLRCGDTLLDAAFLAMDIERCGSSSLAQAFLDEYRSASQEDAPVSLAHHYIAYRALVRAKVTALRVEQGDRSAIPAAQSLLALALEHLGQGQVRLTVVSGLPASGKSTLARFLQTKWGSARTSLLLQSDVVRDEAAPTTAEPDGLAAGRYSPSGRAKVYRTMLERAGSGLRSGTDVILDATFSESWTRTAVEDLAASCHARLQVLQCEIPESVALQRLTRRVRGADTRSEADALVYRHLADSATTWPAAQPIDMSVDIEEAYNQVEQFIR